LATCQPITATVRHLSANHSDYWPPVSQSQWLLATCQPITVTIGHLSANQSDYWPPSANRRPSSTNRTLLQNQTKFTKKLAGRRARSSPWSDSQVALTQVGLILSQTNSFSECGEWKSCLLLPRPPFLPQHHRSCWEGELLQC
jgi:hypothetical protein